MKIKAHIRPAQREDMPEVLRHIRLLAAFERAPQEVTVTLEELERDGFGEKPIFTVNVAEVEGEIVGIALFYIAYSTWKGKMVYLDDLFVQEAYRGQGIGSALFDTVVDYSLQENANILKWQVLDWNQPAIDFYNKIKAELDGEWINCKLDKTTLNNLRRTVENR